MKKTIVTLLAAVTLMGTATVTTACSNNTKTEQTEQHSAKKVTKEEIKNHDYVGVGKDNKNQYISFYTGKGSKIITYIRVSKDGSQKTITYFLKKPKLVINKKDPKKFKIDGYRVTAEPDFDWTFKKVGKRTIQTSDNKKWKLYNGSHKSVVKYVQKQAKTMPDAQ